MTGPVSARMVLADPQIDIAVHEGSHTELVGPLRDGDIVSPLIESSEPLKNEASHFIACVRDGRPPAYDAHAVELNRQGALEVVGLSGRWERDTAFPERMC